MPHISVLDVHSSDGQPTAGFRSLLGRLALPPCILLTGPNGSGKTAHLNLVEAAVMGLTKSRAVGGKTNAKDAGKVRRVYLGDDLFPSAEVRLALSTGQSFTRPLDQANENAKAVQDADADARRLVGQPAVPWTATDFLHSSDLAREQLFAAAAQAGGKIEDWDSARAMAETRTLLLDQRPEDIDEEIWGAPLDALCAKYTEAEGGGGQWLVLVLAPAEERRLAAGRTKDSAKAAHARHMSTRPKMPTSDRAAARARRSAALVRQSDALQVEARAARYAEQKAAHSAEVTRLQSAVAAIVTDGQRLRAEQTAAKAAPLPTLAEIPADVQAELDAATAESTAPIPPPDGSRIPVIEQAVLAASTAHDEAVAASAVTHQALVAANVTATAASTAHGTAAEAASISRESFNDAASMVKALEHVSAGGDGTCVHCGKADPLGHGKELDAARERFQEAQQHDAAHHAELDRLAAELHSAEAVERDANVAHSQAGTAQHRAALALDAARATLDEARLGIAGHDARIQQARQVRLDRATVAVTREQARCRADLDRATAAHAERIARADAALTELLTSHRRATMALAAAEQNPPTVPPTGDDVSDVPGILAECEQVEAAWLAYELAEQQAERSAAEALAASIAHSAAEATVQALRGAREYLASTVYEPVQAHMRAIMARCGAALPVPYFRGPTRIGATRPESPGVDVDLASLSASEQLITLTALTCAMSRIAGLPLVIAMFDEVGKLQPDHRVPLLRGLCEAQAAGEIDQVLFTLPTSEKEADAEVELAPYREIPGLEVRRLSRPTAGLAPVADHVVTPMTIATLLASSGDGDDLPF